MKFQTLARFLTVCGALAYGGTLHAQSCPGDLDHDGVVGSGDFARLLDAWGKCRGCASDLDGDGAVGALDLGVLLESWGACPQSDPGNGSFWQHDDGTITYAGRKYASWSDYLASVAPNLWRCGAKFAPPAHGRGGPAGEGGVAAVESDCDYNATVPKPEYQPGDTMCITVVVHVIRNTSGTLGDVPPERIVEQIDVLNSTYGPARIRFQLATRDPAGMPTLGFDYHNDDSWYNDQGDYMTPLAWDTSRYLNLYTNTAASFGPGTLGYAVFPWDIEVGTAADRVVINWQHFGISGGGPYNLGITCAHEVGHFLGLLHTFEQRQDSNGDGIADAQGADGCATGCCYASGDLCCDTGRESVAHFGCDPTIATCDDGLDPIADYMDYSDDVCMSRFTREQIGRMRCTLLSRRASLVAACAVPGDLDGDGVVGARDLAALLAAWDACDSGSCPADLNRDNVVDARDLAMLVGDWYDEPLPRRTVPGWADPIEADPDPAIVTNAALRAAISATGLAWRVRDRGTGIEMLLVPPGIFEMGCSQANSFACDGPDLDLPVHTVRLTCAYYIGRYEVTQGQWLALTGSNPSTFKPPTYTLDLNRPVEKVSWSMIQPFLAATGLRLPTEAEWEFACRAGTTTPFHSMPGFPDGTANDALVGNIAWYSGNNGNPENPNGTPLYGTKAVGGKAANALGLHDMLGNVEEFVNDWYAGYSAATQTNPVGPPAGSFRVRRGGAWTYNTNVVRSFYRNAYAPNIAVNWVGFRVAKSP